MIISNAGKDAETLPVEERMQNGTAILENSLAIVFKTENRFTIKPSSCLSGIYSGEMKIEFHVGACTQMFIVVLFIKSSNWKPSKNEKQKSCE